jgi:dihydropteroate synthase
VVRKETLLQVKGTNHLLGPRTWIMGVLNVTPDSFYDGGRHFEPEAAVDHGLALVEDGADILDIGGESTRPGSDPVPAEEEVRRVLPVLAALRPKTRALLSVDTTKPDVARAALEAGADIINDIDAASLDPRLLRLAADAGAGFVLMHMKGVPKTMQVNPTYGDVAAEVRAFLAEKVDIAEAYGLNRERILVDPGIGFGKRLEDNLELIRRLDVLAALDRPVLVGVSRKSFIGKILNLPPDDRLEGTLAAAVLSLARGAHILRVHDVRAARRAALVADAILAGPAAGPPSAETRARHVH